MDYIPPPKKPVVDQDKPFRERGPDHVKITFGQTSKQGQRDINEDAFACITPTSLDARINKGVGAMVADGTGGDGSGRDASHYVQSELFSEYYSTPESWTVEQSVNAALTAINNWLFSQRSTGKSLICTLSFLLLRGRRYYIAHLGDTRIYLWRRGELTCLTEDHHFPGHHNRLVRAMGLDRIVRPDFISNDLEIGDMFIMTTDGVHGIINDEKIVEILKKGFEPQELSDKLVTLCSALGSKDNITVQVIHVDELPLPNRSEMLEEEQHLVAAPMLTAGQEVDAYKIVKHMATGGMAHIYEAIETESGKRMALKCPKPEWMKNTVQMERFHREEWAGLRLHSPYLLQMFPPKTKRTEYYYMVMEYCPGKSIRQYISDGGKPSLDLVLNLAQQVCRGLHFMHNLNMIHRDIKPENIVITEEGSIKIVDYGIVRLPGLAELSNKKESRSLIGSPAYMAPDFFKQSTRGNFQTDIYALGIVLYEFLTGGQFPFGKVDDLDFKQKMPAYVPVHKYRDDVPDWLNQLLFKTVHWDPEKRYGAVSEILYLLQHPGEVGIVKTEVTSVLTHHGDQFWKWTSLFQLVIIIIMFYLLIK